MARAIKYMARAKQYMARARSYMRAPEKICARIYFLVRVYMARAI